ncbi:MAG TPA: class I SAM-dependent methyltransferase [Polyangiaceae bacterium]|nr:class I SAM-dependent methyltransferase [Polyangiaceae bacterium]
MKAELYALTHRGNPGDVAFYGNVCRGAKSVLELGSGSGRLLTALASAKRQLVGLELDPELLALAKRNLGSLPAALRKSVQLVRADMRDFELPRRFERVLLPYNALYCLLTQRAALACFRAARRALEPGGLLALDVWNAEPFQRNPTQTGVDDPDPIVTLSHAGRTWDVFERSRVRRSQQRLDVSYRYVPRERGSALEIPIAQRYYLSGEISDLLQRAGFAIEARQGDFSGRRFSVRSAQLIVLARAL